MSKLLDLLLSSSYDCLNLGAKSFLFVRVINVLTLMAVINANVRMDSISTKVNQI